MMVYIAANKPLPLIPWDQAHPAFHVTEVREQDRIVSIQFTKSHVYYVGSHEGCGCGFQFGQFPDFENPNDVSNARRSRQQLVDYLNKVLKTHLEIELFADLSGGEGTIAEQRSDLMPDDLMSARTYFFESELVRLSTRQR